MVKLFLSEGRKNLFPVLVLDWGDRPIPFTDYFKQALFHKSMICDFSSKMYYIKICKIFKIDSFKSSSLKYWRIFQLFSSLESCECQLSNEPKNLKIGPKTPEPGFSKGLKKHTFLAQNERFRQLAPYSLVRFGCSYARWKAINVSFPTSPRTSKSDNKHQSWVPSIVAKLAILHKNQYLREKLWTTMSKNAILGLVLKLLM